MLGDYFCYSKTGGSSLHIKDATDQETIFNFELCVFKVYLAHLFKVRFYRIIPNGG